MVSCAALHSIDIADLTLESFQPEFKEQQVLYWHGVDKENRKICKLLLSCVMFIYSTHCESLCHQR